MNPNNINKVKAAKRAKLKVEATTEYINFKYESMVKLIDGSSTPDELLILLNDDFPIESLQMKYVDNKNLLFFACQYNGYEGFALRLWELYPGAAIDQDGWVNHRNPLQIACSEGRFDIASKLLEYSDNIFLNMPDSHGRTALFHASKKNNVNLAKLLLQDKNIDVNVQDKYGQTSLHISCLHLSYGVIELLLNDKNIKLNLMDHAGLLENGTPIRTLFRTISMTRLYELSDMHHILNTFLRLIDFKEITCLLQEHAKGGWKYFYAIDYLMQNGYEQMINQQDSWGRTPFHYACQQSDQTILHIDHYMKKFMKTPNLLVNVKDFRGRTPLHEACRRTNYNMVSFLLKGDYNVNVNLSDDDGNSALHQTIDGWFRTMDDLNCTNVMTYLLWKNPFIIFHRNNNNENTYEYAMMLHQREEVYKIPLVGVFWERLSSFLKDHMHKARILMYKSLNGEQPDGDDDI
jgi:ankyrin repeat protein